MYDKICKGLYLFFSNILLPLVLIILLIGLFIASPIYLLVKGFDISFIKSTIYIAIAYGTIFILRILAKAIKHGRNLVEDEMLKAYEKAEAKKEAKKIKSIKKL